MPSGIVWIPTLHLYRGRSGLQVDLMCDPIMLLFSIEGMVTNGGSTLTITGIDAFSLLNVINELVLRYVEVPTLCCGLLSNLHQSSPMISSKENSSSCTGASLPSQGSRVYHVVGTAGKR